MTSAACDVDERLPGVRLTVTTGTLAVLVERRKGPVPLRETVAGGFVAVVLVRAVEPESALARFEAPACATRSLCR